MTNHPARIIKNRAKWNVQEILAIIIFLGVIGLVGISYATQVITELALVIVFASIALGVVLLLIVMSLRRKSRSTLFAKLNDDRNHNIQVWMRHPKKTKWKGRMDEGTNKGPLATIIGAHFEDIEDTPVMVIKLKGGKPVMIPLRLAEMEAIKKYLGSAVASTSTKLKFDNKETATKFASMIILPTEEELAKKEYQPDVVEEVVEDKKNLSEQTETVDSANDQSLDVEIQEKPIKPSKQIKLDYSEYNKPVIRDNSPVLSENENGKITVGSIAGAVDSEILEANKITVNEEVINASNVLSLSDKDITNVSIDLSGFTTEETPEKEV